ncbi:hypothetical protein Sros01_09330 [Streptomyces roseochromogenus]|nr:hypothetical protein Sros01_09330 [Streptomyces roseochromogenus]
MSEGRDTGTARSLSATCPSGPVPDISSVVATARKTSTHTGSGWARQRAITVGSVALYSPLVSSSTPNGSGSRTGVPNACGPSTPV